MGTPSGPAKERSAWKGMLEGYLTTRETLRVIFVLVDAEVGPTPLDHQMIEWLQSIDRDYRVVAAKSDRVKASRQLAQRRDVAAVLGLTTPDIAWVSSSTGMGIDELRRRSCGDSGPALIERGGNREGAGDSGSAGKPVKQRR
mgnify:CR=1 FL=1